MDGGAWKATVHGVAKSQTRLSSFTFLDNALKKNCNPANIKWCFLRFFGWRRVWLVSSPFLFSGQASRHIPDTSLYPRWRDEGFNLNWGVTFECLCFGWFFLRAVWITGFRRQGGGARGKGGDSCRKSGETGLSTLEVCSWQMQDEAFAVLLFSHSGVFSSAAPWTAACWASLSIANSWSLLKLMAIESVMPSNHLILSRPPSLLKFMSIDSVMPSNHLILCHPLLLLPSVFPSIRVFSRELVLRTRCQSIGASALASVLPMNIQGWFPLGVTAQDLHTHN